MQSRPGFLLSYFFPGKGPTYVPGPSLLWGDCSEHELWLLPAVSAMVMKLGRGTFLELQTNHRLSFHNHGERRYY